MRATNEARLRPQPQLLNRYRPLPLRRRVPAQFDRRKRKPNSQSPPTTRRGSAPIEVQAASSPISRLELPLPRSHRLRHPLLRPLLHPRLQLRLTPAAAAAERAEADSKKEVAANSGLAPLAAARQAFAPNQIVAADGTTRWRIVNGQQVERSTNAGANWTPATITSTDALSAAAAPSATVCWIVGARGAVYVTTDGTRFVRVPFPEIVDLTSVSATDGLAATVSSADGRSLAHHRPGKNVVRRPLVIPGFSCRRRVLELGLN